MTRLNINLPDDLMDTAKTVAAHEDRTLTAVVTRALNEYIARYRDRITAPTKNRTR